MFFVLLSPCTNFILLWQEEVRLRFSDFVTLLVEPKGSFVATDAHSRRRNKN